ncbi:FxSxx-COOH system tetratricopeptide repeat protein [Streptomyces sp. cg35]|uniref:FxSxx-COOH system tetratricopeptide repeat protein n=1 Tax=Streptomyces sp. cg35 TaxID=3421650 RepID=UPI003D17408E
MSGDRQLVLEPVVSWPRQAEAGRTYLMTVDLRIPVTDWPYAEEEFTFGLMVDGAPRFRVESLGDPSVVVHRFGGTYGPARFAVTSGASTGPGVLWLTVTNRWGLPVRKIELPSRVVAPADEAAGGGPTWSVPTGLPLSTPEAGAVEQHLTICHTGSGRPWAAWIAHQAESAGLGTTLLRRAPEAQTAPGDVLDTLFATPGRILLVLGADFFGPENHAAAEWARALRAAAPADAERLAAVSVTTGVPPAVVAALDPVPLAGLDARRARARLLHGLGVDPPGTARAEDGPRYPGDAQALWNVPPRSERFTGRDEILDAIHDTFATGTRRCVLHGVAGVGKTQIAREYAYRFRDEYDMVWQIDAGHPNTAREQLAGLAALLEVPAGTGTGDRIRAVRDALRRGRPHRRWLLVFDGVRSVAEVAELLPEGPGHILITALAPDEADPDGDDAIEIPPFTRSESLALARVRAPRLTPEEADALADAVRDLPLLLNQTAAWLAINETMPVRSYIEGIRTAEPGEYASGTPAEIYGASVRTSWALVQNMLRESDPDARELLNLFAFFSPDAIPVGFIRSTPPDDLDEHVAALAGDAEWHEMLQRLHVAMLAIRRDPPLGTEQVDEDATVQMHRLHHDQLRGAMPENERAAASAAACRVLAAAAPGDPNDTRKWPRYARIIPHLDHAGVFDSTDGRVQDLVLDCVDYLRVRGEHAAGLELCEKTLPLWHQRLEQSDRRLILLEFLHSVMLRRVGRYREAEAMGRTSVVRLQRHAPDSSELLQAQAGLGGSLMALAAYEEARQLFHSVWKARRRLLGGDHPRTLGDYHNYAEVLSQLGQYQQALEIEQQVQRDRTRILRARHPSTLASGTVCATLLRLLGHYGEAASLQEQNVRVHRQAMDRHHPQTLRAEQNLALCLHAVGESRRAEELMRTVLTRARQVHGLRHPDTLAVQTGYAGLLRARGAGERAQELADIAAEGYADLLGDAHPFTAGALGNVALVRAAAGDHDRAGPLAELALARMSVAVGTEHPWTVSCALNASGVRAATGDARGAAEHSAHAVRAGRAVLGDRHPLTLLAMAAQAFDLRTLGSREADEQETGVLSALSDTLGDQHPHTVSVRRRFRPYWDFEPQPV